MEDSRLLGAKDGVQRMLFYYLTALIDNGVKDPKQHIATEIGKMVDLSEEQVTYVKANVRLKGQVPESLTSSIDILKNMEKTKAFDKEAVDIVIGLLSAMKDSCSKVMDGDESG